MTPTLDIDLLRAFCAVADARSFTKAAVRLGRTQSTVSLQIRRLEEALGRRVLERSPREVALTAFGEGFLEDARRVVSVHDEALARLEEPRLAGRVRLGTPEDFATARLPDVLSRFAATHPGVALEVTCDLTLNLMARHAAGEFDLLLVKREPVGESVGTRVWREGLVWVALDHRFDAGAGAAGGGGTRDEAVAGAPVPLVVSPPPCVYRKRATRALEEAGRGFRVAYTCGALSGALAAVRAGLGVAVLPRGVVPAGLTVLSDGWPDLRDTEIALILAEPASRPALKLAEHIVRSLEREEAGRPAPDATVEAAA